MADSAASEAPQQAQSVVDHLWQLQYAQYCVAQAPGHILHPAQAQSAQQSTLDYSFPAYQQCQPAPPAGYSAQYSRNSGNGYTPLAP